MADTLQNKSLEELRTEFEARLKQLMAKASSPEEEESPLPEAPETSEDPIPYDDSLEDVRLAAARRAQEQF